MMFAEENLRLRALEPEDLEWLYEVENDDGLWKWGCSNVPYSRYALKKYISETCHDIYADGQLRLVAEAGGEVMGCVDLMNFSPRHLRAEVGILLFPGFRECGYGSKVLQMVISYARIHLYMHQLYAVVSRENVPAQRLFEKNGFGRISVLEDWLRDDTGNYISAYLYSLHLQA